MWQGGRVKRIALALLSALLLALAQGLPALAPVALVALVPWLWASRRAGAGEALLLGALVGTLYGCLVVPWIPEALRSLGSSGLSPVLGLVAASAWAKLPLFAGVAWIAQRLRSQPDAVQVAAVACAFGLGEWAAGIWRLGIPWALLGHSQLAVPGVAQLAAVGGVPLLSAWLVAINAAIALSVGRVAPARRLAVSLVISWLAMAWLGLPLAEWVRPGRPAADRADLLVVQPEIPRDARWDARAQPWILASMANHTSAALASQERRPDAIIWPENLLTTPLESGPELARAMQAHVDAWGVPLITGLVRPSALGVPRSYLSSVVWIEPGRGAVAAIDKFRAIPLLESSRVRDGASWLAPLFGRATAWPKVEEATAPGSSITSKFSITPALCYEVLFPQIVAHRRSPESLAILNLADDSWVSGEMATRQLSRFAAFRAIEQRLTLIRVAHGGLSSVVDEFGQTQLELPLDRWTHARVIVRGSVPPTGLERAALIGLPLSTGCGVWWMLGAWTGRTPARANRETTEAKETPS
jgi:apolipoprotein N-acyltransferase